ncbi:uncharacterized protein LOC119189912 isoform X2 [Manduca sexta]|uniref:uncharacterized protein LOC119189912 isoform X2 n=1 Tax=Manduca sexta TaxID=7130 RepID=UPI0018906A65|nr:uncharacterized protein LOC119189912 isoform X2 [Manduca sexta]
MVKSMLCAFPAHTLASRDFKDFVHINNTDIVLNLEAICSCNGYSKDPEVETIKYKLKYSWAYLERTRISTKIDAACRTVGFIKDTTDTVCIPNCDPGYKHVNGSCQPTSEILSDNDVANNKFNTTEPYASTCDNSPNILFFVSAFINIILLVIIFVIVFKKCRTGARDNKNNMTKPRDTYVDMNSASRNPVLFTKNESVPENARSGCSEHNVPVGRCDSPHYEYIPCIRTTTTSDTDDGSSEKLCYDYVQTPLPIHLRQAKQQVPPRGWNPAHS